MAGKTNRSNGYQHLFAEQSYSHEMLSDFAESQGMNENYSPEDHELLLDLHEQLTEEFWKLVNEQLTPRQAQVLKLLAMGYTQIEIAKQLNVNQSSITKSVNGNCDYRNGRRVYGGGKKRIRTLVKEHPVFQELFKKIGEIHSQYNT